MEPKKGSQKRPVNPIGWGFGIAWDRAGDREAGRAPGQGFAWARGFGMSRDLPREEPAAKRMG